MSQRTKRSSPAWAFWQKAEKALEETQELMQVAATIITQDGQPIHLPPMLVRTIKRDISHFQEQFALLIREQKQEEAR